MDAHMRSHGGAAWDRLRFRDSASGARRTNDPRRKVLKKIRWTTNLMELNNDH